MPYTSIYEFHIAKQRMACLLTQFGKIPLTHQAASKKLRKLTEFMNEAATFIQQLATCNASCTVCVSDSLLDITIEKQLLEYIISPRQVHFICSIICKIRELREVIQTNKSGYWTASSCSLRQSLVDLESTFARCVEACPLYFEKESERKHQLELVIAVRDCKRAHIRNPPKCRRDVAVVVVPDEDDEPAKPPRTHSYGLRSRAKKAQP
jgi:hypothetical protein